MSDSGSNRVLRIGGGLGFWGESSRALPSLLDTPDLDFVVLDYLAEITMSIVARARAKDPQAGYATDFVSSVLKPHLATLAERRIRVIASAGGVNPEACGAAVRKLIDAADLDLSVGVVTGDDLLARAAEHADAGIEGIDGEPFPPVDRLVSANAYLGAGPVAAALDAGADIVITGRVVDSALTLGACIHAFGWGGDQLDLLATGSVAGHLIECSTQATGGNDTDWAAIPGGLAELGCPIAEIDAAGNLVLTKAPGTGGSVTAGSVGEQLLYEIGDPRAYVLPDVTCDFSNVTLEAIGEDRVAVAGARGRPAPEALKVSATWQDGFRGGQVVFFEGPEARACADAFSDSVRRRAEATLADVGLGTFEEFLTETLGGSSELTLKIAARHPRAEGVGILLRELIGAALAAPPGLSLFTGGGRPRPSPVVRLFSYLVPREAALPTVTVDGAAVPCSWSPQLGTPDATARSHDEPEAPVLPETQLVPVPLVQLARVRSGDKGNDANIGVLARDRDAIPWLWRALTSDAVGRVFGNQIEGAIERYWMPGPSAINFVLRASLGGGGVASLRNDPQGKAFGQRLLALTVDVPQALARELEESS